MQQLSRIDILLLRIRINSCELFGKMIRNDSEFQNITAGMVLNHDMVRSVKHFKKSFTTKLYRMRIVHNESSFSCPGDNWSRGRA